jgi:hypothetical protein
MGGWQPTLGTLAHLFFHFRSPFSFHGMYRRFGVVHHGGFPVFFVLIFGALCWWCFEDDFLGLLVGVTYEVLVPLWLVTLPPKSPLNRTRFGGFSSWASS